MARTTPDDGFIIWRHEDAPGPKTIEDADQRVRDSGLTVGRWRRTLACDGHRGWVFYVRSGDIVYARGYAETLKGGGRG